MQNKWFRWEREAAIHLLFPTLEGSMEPLKKYVGFSFPTNILIFKDGIVTWCLPEDEFYEVGRKLRKIYTDPSKERLMVKDTNDSLQKLLGIEEIIGKTDFQKISNQELLDLYQKLYQAFLLTYAIGAISTPLYFEAEHYLKEVVKLSDLQLNTLAAPKGGSYTKKAEKYLLKTGDIGGFIKKYFWMNNNYAGTSYLTEAEVKQRLEDIKKEKNLEQPRDQKLILKLNGEAKKTIDLLRNFSLYKDERKKNIFIFLHYFELLLKEIAQRSKLSLDDTRNIFPWEIELALKGKIKSLTIQKRKKFCVVVWEEGKAKPEVCVGDKARGWEKLTLEKKEQTNTIKGNPASRGKVQGRVRVLFSAKDCHLLQKGEVLVTFMTSPDFISAMRKASAVITNLGGVTSHAAIISRELGIPCIVGTKVATKILKDGDLVGVDADSGTVSVIHST